MLGIIVIMDRAVGAGDLVFSFLKHFPTFGIIPILFSLITLFFFYVAFKVRGGSKFSFWLGIGSIFIPLPTAFLSQMLMSPFVKLATRFDNATSDNIPTVPINPINLRFGDPIFVLSFIALVLLITSFKKFHFVNHKLSKKVRVFLITLAVILVLPTLSILSYKYIRANDTDYGFNKAQSEVKYRVHKPTTIPSGLTYATKFITNKELAGKQNAVQVAFDIPFNELAKGESPKVIVLKQIGVEPGFNLELFISTEVKDSTSEPISFPIALDQKAYFLQKKLGTSDLNFFTFITQDNVLIFIASPKTSRDELISFAESLN